MILDQVTVELRCGWRWHLAIWTLRIPGVKRLIGIPRALRFVNWGLAGASTRVGKGPWERIKGLRLVLEEQA